MEELSVRAEDIKLEEVIRFIQGQLDKAPCSKKIKQQIELAAEEVFVNIAHYAYGPEGGKVRIEAGYEEDKTFFYLRFKDSGKAYNPLLKKDPDIAMAAESREIGGLGIYFMKKLMDEVHYQYQDSQNILWMKKQTAEKEQGTEPDKKTK